MVKPGVGQRERPTLLERDHPLGTLHALFRDAANGDGRIAAISAEAGGGKTSLVSEFVGSLRDRAAVFTGGCDPLSTPRPLGPLLDIAWRLSPQLDALVKTDYERFRVFQTFRDALARDRRPKLIVFEDLHWADDATLDLIRFVGRRLDGVHALLIITFREDEIDAVHGLRLVLGDLASSGVVRRIELSPLSKQAVSALAKGRGIDPAQLYRETGGNPFFVTEVLAAGGDRAPSTVRDAVLSRVSRLGPELRRIIETAAIIGPAMERRFLERVLGADAPVVDVSHFSGLIHEPERGRLAFRHELAREAILSSVPAARRASVSNSVLAALRESPAEPDALAILAHFAEEAGDSEAVQEFAPRAARHASMLSAHHEAAAQYRRALRFAERLEPAALGTLLEAFARESLAISRLEDGIDARARAAAIWRQIGNRAREAENLGALSQHLVMIGRNEQAEATAQKAMSALEGLPIGPEHGRVYQAQASLRMLDRDSEQAIEWGTRAIELARQFDDHETLIAALNTVGSARIVAGEYDGVEQLEESLRLARDHGSDMDLALAYTNLGSALGEQFVLHEAERWLGEGIDFATRYDLDTLREYMRAWLAVTRTYLGDYASAIAMAKDVEAREGTSPVIRLMALVALGRVYARQGHSATGSVLDEALDLARPTGTLQRLGPVHCARAEAAWLAGDLDRTQVEAAAGYDLAFGHRHAWFAGELAYWLAKSGHDVDLPDWIAAPYRLELTGDPLAAAVEWESLGCHYEAARARLESDDDVSLRSAHATLTRLGAMPLANRVAARMRDLGLRDIPRQPRASTKANPAGLTRRQVEVLALMVEGLTNLEIADRLFISPKTVENHVSAILEKLGVRSRVEAVVEATRLNLER